MGYFKYKELLTLPLRRAAYSDRTAWLMAEMSRLAYAKFEDNHGELENALTEADFKLIQIFNCFDTQAFLAKRDKDRIAVLAFRGTEINKPIDILADLDFRFYKKEDGTKVHDGFQKAFECVKVNITEEINKLEEGAYSIYITGHSLGGAIALVAARNFSSDKIAACYTFGSPRVGNSEFGDQIKPPIYRIVNANDLVPRIPFPFVIIILNWMGQFKSLNIFRYIFSEKGCYAHYGDQRYLTPCKEDFSDLRLLSNPGLPEALYRYNNIFNVKLGINDHNYDNYCNKLAQYALKRNKPDLDIIQEASQNCQSPSFESVPNIMTHKIQGGFMLNFFDSYERIARVYPAIVISLPVIITCYSYSPLVQSTMFIKLTSELLIVLVLIVLMVNIVRFLGKRIERRIWESWGGPPTTRFLRLNDKQIALELKKKFYDKILIKSGIDLHNNTSDEKIEQAISFVRSDSRGREGLWNKFNSEYGYARNLLGSRLIWLILSFASSGVCLLIAKFTHENRLPLMIGAIFNAFWGIVAIFCGWFVFPGLIKGIAERYAEDFIISYINRN